MGDFVYEHSLVQALLREQHPDLADLEIRDVAGGWGNQQFRLGDELAVRLPRYGEAPLQLRQEQKWLPVLAERLPLPVPVPVRIGEPSELFEHPWTVMRWVEGEPADLTPITRAESAERLAAFLNALHHDAPDDAPANPRHAGPSAVRPGDFERWLDKIEGHPSADDALKVWQKAVAAPVWPGAPQFLHADLHPANVIVRDGALAGVVDFGDMGAGDPAIDLSAAWILLPAGSANPFFEAYGRADEADIARARGWAVMRALNLIAIGRAGRLGKPGGKPTWEPAGYATLERALAED
ncbi:aminoglycoside phosphotransferase family protein [Catenulispora rubra]|uniref:aminoglycoside phosphotransferase family protein n=1 Tax=Catenulispora rubra TaxID=280293 RepID=UPI001892504C|nr:aminoglycoside phosphotransferase family protein [Catenulispora rubra]